MFHICKRQHQERLVGERIVKGGYARPDKMEASHKTHQPHIKVGKDEEKKEFHICKRFAARIIHHAQQTTAQTRCITSNMLTPWGS